MTNVDKFKKLYQNNYIIMSELLRDNNNTKEIPLTKKEKEELLEWAGEDDMTVTPDGDIVCTLFT